jgi:hypothetical protein
LVYAADDVKGYQHEAGDPSHHQDQSEDRAGRAHG